MYETLTVKDIKEILKIGANSAYALIHSKAFPVVRIGNSYRISKEPFHSWLTRDTGRQASTSWQ